MGNRTLGEGAKKFGEEKLGNYDCQIWRDANGSSTTFTWIDEDNIVRQRLVIGNRNIEIETTADERAFFRHKGERFYLDEFMAMQNPVTIDRWKFTHSSHDTAFSGHYIGIPANQWHNADIIYVARVTC